jgi:hypothetical protein
MPLKKATQAVIAPNICTTDTEQIITGTKTFNNANVTGSFTGNIAGNVTGNVTGNVIGNVTGDLTGKITGVTDGSNAPAGYVGEIIKSTVPVESAVSLTTNTTSNITNISLPAGDWYVNGQVDYRAAATTSITILTQGISQTSATLGSQDTFSRLIGSAFVPTASNDACLPIRGQRISLTTTTTIYLVARPTFTVSTLTGYGTIEARRIR